MSDIGHNRWLLPGGIVLLIAVLTVVALARDPVRLDPTTPEGTVQGYLQAIGDDDYESALEVLDPDGPGTCVAADIARSAPGEPFTATLLEDRSDVGADEAIIAVRLRFGTDDVFGSGWDTVETFDLVSKNGSWRITGQPWPYFDWSCDNREDF